MPNNYLIQIVASESTPEKEAEFNKWYTDVHVPMLFEFEGVKQVSRYRRQGDNEQCAKYLAFYEFESEEALDAFHRSSAFAAAGADFKDKIEDTGFTIKWAGAYELIKSWERS